MPGTPNSIITPQTVKTGNAVVTSAYAQPITDAPAGAQLIYTAGSNGARITRLVATPRNTVSATQLAAFKSTNGTTLRVGPMVSMPAYTITTGNAPVPTDFGFSEGFPLMLGAGEQLWVGSAVALAAGIVFHAEGADY